MGGLSFLASEAGLPEPGPWPENVTFERRDGGRLHGLDWGGTGPGVLFLHGGALSAHTWTLCCSLLRHERRCVALDLRGHGDSDWADDYSIPAHVGDVHGVIEQLGWRAPDLVGMSLGGIVAAHAALSATSFVPSSLTLVDVAPGVSFGASSRLREFVLADTVKGGVPALIAEARNLGARNSDAELFYRYAALVRQNADGTWRWKRDDRRPVDFGHILDHIAHLDRLAPKIAWPCMVVRGGLSRILTEKAAQNFADKCPNGTMRVVENAGHSVQEDNPRGFADALTAFWDGNSEKSG